MTFDAANVRITRAGTSFTVSGDNPWTGAIVTLQRAGERYVEPALASLEASLEEGLPLELALTAATSSSRGERWDMQALYPSPGILVLNDASEATPSTTIAALKTLAELALDGSRSIAVLGEVDVDDPTEWREEHDRIGRIVVRLNISKLVVVGDGARHIHNAAGLEGSWDGESVLVGTAEEAYDLLGVDLRDGDVVLVKSSASAGLGSLGDRLGGADSW
ncbi:hypothetical protein EYE40_03565 [Glaciihabitans arcticus]|uniref:Mur ligase C-terminal domain-containing protein n=1 Tax=Glaciihabitans arcticus TaxID=2668039 RepID=A0A4Q9GSG2_9MICO|nr:cyanophycin synthetase [Glaciihabitans arcticus]TBN56548.1 hypothetical protein EYE40_03565 [Glaciihabitans arcticus]